MYVQALDRQRPRPPSGTSRSAGRAASPRRAEPLRWRRLVPRRQPAHPGPRGRADQTGPGQLPDAGGGRARAVPDHRASATTSTRAESSSTPARPRRTTGSSAGHVGGIYYGLDGDPTQDCVVTAGPVLRLPAAGRRLRQYYLGALQPRQRPTAPTGFDGRPAPLAGVGGELRRAVPSTDNPLDEAGSFTGHQRRARRRRVPAVRQHDGRRLRAGAGGAFDPVEGDWYVGGLHVDDSYMRLARTIDLTGVAAGTRRRWTSQLSLDIEPDYDNVIVEAHTVGPGRLDDAARGRRADHTRSPAECEAGFLLDEHPFLSHYLTPGRPVRQHRHDRVVEPMTGNSAAGSRCRSTCPPTPASRSRSRSSLRDRPGLARQSARSSTTPGSSSMATVAEARASSPGSAPWTIAAPPPGSPGHRRLHAVGQPVLAGRPHARHACCSASVSSRSSRRPTRPRSSDAPCDRWG